ncbi:polysaccharide pyruvyl transferase family protein [Plantibacter sp. 2H11-2]|uniref:polysaccharide pyruvyl transferase family protein n=1 Tax=Plantibacter sp. 2H11-2 TaxID=3414431 RepID=UPI003CF16510
MVTENIYGVAVEHWNPFVPRFSGRIGARLPIGRRRNNFGDLLGPVIVRRLLEQGVGDQSTLRALPQDGKRLVAVGSILHFAHDGDTVWGTGVNGKMPESKHTFNRLDIRAVRGPRTFDFLEARGLEPERVFGDPGLLVPRVFDHLPALSVKKAHALTIVPNLHDHPVWASHPATIDPTGDLVGILERIAQSERVVGSSLHGLVVAESLGIPATLIAPAAESMFKYEDYYGGTGRDSFPVTHDLREALAQAPDPLAWDAQPLIDAFPLDLWSGPRRSSGSTHPTTP